MYWTVSAACKCGTDV